MVLLKPVLFRAIFWRFH